MGFDVHPFSDDPGRRLVLGGVTLAGERGLAGHSDADVVAHAGADALLGPAGLGDLGERFPDDDPAWAGWAGERASPVGPSPPACTPRPRDSGPPAQDLRARPPPRPPPHTERDA